MTDLTQTDEFAFVLQLLEAYMTSKRENVLLTAWAKLKDFSPKYMRYCSYISFAKPESDRDEDLEQGQQVVRRPGHCRNNSSPIKLNQQIKAPQGMPTFTHERQQIRRESIGQAQQDDEFEDIILKRLQNLQQAMSNSKSRTGSSVNGSFISRTERSQRTLNPSKSSKTRLRFSLNPKYIPMREKLQQMNPMVVESQADPYYGQDGSSGKGDQKYRNNHSQRASKQPQIPRKNIAREPVLYNINQMLNKLGSVYNSSSNSSSSNPDLSQDIYSEKNNSFQIPHSNIRHKIYDQELKNVKIADYPTFETLKLLRHREKPVVSPRLNQSYSCIIEKKPKFTGKNNNSTVLHQVYD